MQQDDTYTQTPRTNIEDQAKTLLAHVFMDIAENGKLQSRLASLGIC